MSNVGMIIEERPTKIGNFLVGRLLPFRGRRMVGPFIFIDHMGPAAMGRTENVDVPPHPHIGLSTLTYLFEGSMTHRDSSGIEIDILPGQVNWMTAGSGIVHSERTPEEYRASDKVMHGLQIWVALPRDLEDMEPVFFHASETELPEWADGGISYRLVAGGAFGRQSPVPVYSPLYFLEMKAAERQTVSIGRHLFGESALYILQGSVESEGHVYEPRRILVANDASLCEFTMEKDTILYLFGGDPFPEERFIYWNFVSSSRDKIEAAKERWRRQEFPPVPGETEFVPLPA